MRARHRPEARARCRSDQAQVHLRHQHRPTSRRFCSRSTAASRLTATSRSPADGCHATARFQLPVGTSGIMVEVGRASRSRRPGASVCAGTGAHMAYGSPQPLPLALRREGLQREGRTRCRIRRRRQTRGVPGRRRRHQRWWYRGCHRIVRAGDRSRRLRAGGTGEACLGVEAMLKAALTAYADVLIEDWTFDLGSITSAAAGSAAVASTAPRVGTLPNGGGDAPPATIRARSASRRGRGTRRCRRARGGSHLGRRLDLPRAAAVRRQAVLLRRSVRRTARWVVGDRGHGRSIPRRHDARSNGIRVATHLPCRRRRPALHG